MIDKEWIEEYKIYREKIDKLQNDIKQIKSEWEQRQNYFFDNGADIKQINILLKDFHTKNTK
jgi:hypothetical protein